MRSIQFAFILLALFSISRADTNTQDDQDKLDESSKNYCKYMFFLLICLTGFQELVNLFVNSRHKIFS
jgi:hypothetical protein